VSDFYGDIMDLVRPELDLRLAVAAVAQRRGLSKDEVIIEALQDFLAKDLLDPKSPETDHRLAWPAGEEGALEEYSYPWECALSLPSPDTCPDEALDEWISVVELDMARMRHALGELDKKTEDRLVASFDRVMKQYDAIRGRLFTRKGARDARRSKGT
jgi:hypothetical protein